MKKETMIDYIEEGVTQEADYFTIIIEDNDGNIQTILKSLQTIIYTKQKIII